MAKYKDLSETGFTLIELMIVVAIIGILASIALPAYKSYMVKARLTEVISVMDSVKNKTHECVVMYSANPRPHCNNTATLGLSFDDIENASEYINNVDFVDLGQGPERPVEYTVTLNWEALGASQFEGTILYFNADVSPGGALHWGCMFPIRADPALEAYMPALCERETP